MVKVERTKMYGVFVQSSNNCLFSSSNKQLCDAVRDVIRNELRQPRAYTINMTDRITIYSADDGSILLTIPEQYP